MECPSLFDHHTEPVFRFGLSDALHQGPGRSAKGAIIANTWDFHPHPASRQERGGRRAKNKAPEIAASRHATAADVAVSANPERRIVGKSSDGARLPPAWSCAEKNPFIKNGTDRGWAHGFVRNHMATPVADGQNRLHHLVAGRGPVVRSTHAIRRSKLGTRGAGSCAVRGMTVRRMLAGPPTIRRHVFLEWWGDPVTGPAGETRNRISDRRIGL
jgi:hypothetical protein